jgi:hypothetical protein
MTETVWGSMRGYASSRKKGKIPKILLEENTEKKTVKATNSE